MDDAHAPRSRGGAKDASNTGRLTTDEENEKGNVIVSVRVRPEANGSLPNASDWEIDGSKSMVSYRGRDGGDYYYGQSSPSLDCSSTDSITRQCLRSQRSEREGL